MPARRLYTATSLLAREQLVLGRMILPVTSCIGLRPACHLRIMQASIPGLYLLEKVKARALVLTQAPLNQ
jgi:hypothetical protein